TELLVLSPQGHVEHAAAVVADDDTVWLIADAGDAPALAKWLTMMRFRSRVDIAERSDLAVVGFAPGGAAAEAVTAASGGGGCVDPWAHVSPGGWQYAETAEHPGAERPWAEAIVDRAVHPAPALFADVEAAGALAAEALRIAAWRPRWAGEVDER